jgi:serine/threonine protein kinase
MFTPTDESLMFNWHMRYQVIEGICQGLHCLHDNYITHLDLKPDNILFDDKMVPKIVHYGYSRLKNEQICPIIPGNTGGSL